MKKIYTLMVLLVLVFAITLNADYQPYANPTTTTAPTSGGAGLQT